MFNIVTKCQCSIHFRYSLVLGSFPICYYLCIGDIAKRFKFYFTMSKGNMLLGYASGKVGSLVFARRLGQQVTRPYNGSPANPKTRAQMQRRIKWANIINMWRLMKPLLQMGFQNRKTTQSDYNKFVSLNVNQSQAYLLKDEARQGATLLAPYIITSGTLGVRSMRSAAVTDVAVGGIDLAAATIGELSNAVIINNQGFQIGDQVTVFALGQSLVDGIPQVLPYAYKFLLTEMSDDRPAIDAIEVFGSVAPAVDGGFLAFEFSGVEYVSYAGAVVQSRILADGTLAVSDSRLTVEFEVDGVSQSINPFSATQSEALSSYGYNADAFLSPASAGEVVPMPSVSVVTLNGQTIANGGTFNMGQNGNVSVVMTGKNLLLGTPAVAYNGEALEVNVESDTRATAQFQAPSNSNYKLTIDAGRGSYSATIDVGGL